MSDGIADLLRHAAARATQRTSDYDLNDVSLPPGRKLTPAGVLVPVDAKTGNVVLTKRSAALRNHAGQVAFAGGKQDPGDADVVEAALREAEEEIGLSRELVDVVGRMPPHETVTSFSVTPVLAVVGEGYRQKREIGEVSEIFEVPLSHFMDRRNFRIEERMWKGGPRKYFVVPYGPFYIWGATARMLRALCDAMEEG